MGYVDHKVQTDNRAVACAVITCSEACLHEDDESGLLIRTLLEAHGHTHPFHAIAKDDPEEICRLLAELAAREDIQAIILSGGTGISLRDNTFDVVSACLTKTLPGFGELFRMLSYQAIGSAALLSRAVAGLLVTPLSPPSPLAGPAPPTAPAEYRHVLVFAIPGAPSAAELAMTKLILPELSHLVWGMLR